MFNFYKKSNFNDNHTHRTPSPKLQAYSAQVAKRETNLPFPDKLWFTNDFDEAMAFHSELKEYIPDLFERLDTAEVEGLIDLIVDKACKELRNKGLLSEESREMLGR